jgi:hypothetical protein
LFVEHEPAAVVMRPACLGCCSQIHPRYRSTPVQAPSDALPTGCAQSSAIYATSRPSFFCLRCRMKSACLTGRPSHFDRGDGAVQNGRPARGVADPSEADRPAPWTGGLRVAGRHRSHRLRDRAVRPVRLDPLVEVAWRGVPRRLVPRQASAQNKVRSVVLPVRTPAPNVQSREQH